MNIIAKPYRLKDINMVEIVPATFASKRYCWVNLFLL